MAEQWEYAFLVISDLTSDPSPCGRAGQNRALRAWGLARVPMLSLPRAIHADHLARAFALHDAEG